MLLHTDAPSHLEQSKLLHVIDRHRLQVHTGSCRGLFTNVLTCSELKTSKLALKHKSHEIYFGHPACTSFFFDDRSVFLKYADRGLVNDRFYYNMNMSLFNILFWVSNIFLFATNQGMIWVHIIKHGENWSFFQNTYRYSSKLYNENIY